MKVEYTLVVDWPDISPEYNGNDGYEEYLENAIEGWHQEIGCPIFDFKDVKVTWIRKRT